MNGFHFLVFAAVIVGAVYYLPRAIRHDKWLRDLNALDDEELAAALREYPDLFERRRR